MENSRVRISYDPGHSCLTCTASTPEICGQKIAVMQGKKYSGFIPIFFHQGSWRFVCDYWKGETNDGM